MKKILLIIATTISFSMNAQMSDGSYNTSATGTHSVAMGRDTTASGNYSTAMGYKTTASGGTSTAMGLATNAEDYISFAIGSFNETDETLIHTNSHFKILPL